LPNLLNKRLLFSKTAKWKMKKPEEINKHSCDLEQQETDIN